MSLAHRMEGLQETISKALGMEVTAEGCGHDLDFFETHPAHE